MNNGMYTTIPPELDDYSIVTPDEQLEDYISEFAPVDPPIVEPVTMFEIHSKIQHTLITSGYGCINIVSLPKTIDKYNPLNSTFYDGFEVHKEDSKYLKGLLDDMGISYIVSNRGKGHKKQDFIILEDKDFREIYKRINEIPLLIGGPSDELIQI